jgi:hypothetical protein
MKHYFSAISISIFLVASPRTDAQDESPAVRDFDEQPAVSTEPVEKAPPRTPPPVGTTVIGEQESPIGLYIMPWRNSAAEGGLDRPARLLDEALLPLDQDVFRRQVEYHRALSEHLEKQGLVTPVDR